MSFWVEVLSEPEPETGARDVDYFRRAEPMDVTDDMVERAAISLRNFEAYDRSGMEPVDSLDNILVPDYYRNQARAALAAALHWELSSETNEGENR